MLHDISMWVAPASAKENDTLNVEGIEVGFVPPPLPNARLLKAAEFDPERGVLTCVRFDDTTFEINGFLLPKTAPEGARGKKGKKGKKGRNGKDGRDGRDGSEGCEGPEGKRGEDGEKGRKGITGPTGPEGNAGSIGPTGPSGETGAQGIQGVQGAMGPQGAGCFTGPIGDIGLKPIEVVRVQSNVPMETNVHIWGEPDQYIYGGDGEPNNPDPIEFKITPITVKVGSPTSDSIDGTNFEGTGVSNIIEFKGGVGPYSYYWNGDYHADDTITWTLGQNQRSLQLTCRANVDYNKTDTYTGKFSLRIVDEGSAQRDEYLAEAVYLFEFDNPHTENPWDDQVWEPRKGAVAFDMICESPTSVRNYIQHLVINDQLQGLEIDGMGNGNWLDWEGQLEAGNHRLKSTQVIEIVKGQANQFVHVNDLIVRPDCYLFAYRNGRWRWIQAAAIHEKDELYEYRQGKVPITHLQTLTEDRFTVALDTEYLSTFFCAGYLIHDSSGDQ